MFAQFTLPHETLQVCPVECAGAVYALPEDDVVGVLTLDKDCTLEELGGVLSTWMDDRHRPLISLREALCQPAHPTENVVVVLRIGTQLFGLLVDQAHQPSRAVVHPTLEPVMALATFCHIVRLEDGTDVPVLNTIGLALSAQHPEPALALRLAA